MLIQKFILLSALCGTLFTSLNLQALTADASSIRQFLRTQIHNSDGAITAPTRSAKFQIVLGKIYSKKQADGSFRRQYEQICTTEGSIGVYDVPKGGIVTPDISHPLKCKSNLTVGPSTINVWGFIEILRGLNNPFAEGNVIDWKVFVGYFEVKSSDGNFSRYGNQIMSISEDPKQKTAVLVTTSDGLASAGADRQQLDELILLTSRFED
jgi:hypothetical protein